MALRGDLIHWVMEKNYSVYRVQPRLPVQREKGCRWKRTRPPSSYSLIKSAADSRSPDDQRSFSDRHVIVVACDSRRFWNCDVQHLRAVSRLSVRSGSHAADTKTDTNGARARRSSVRTCMLDSSIKTGILGAVRDRKKIDSAPRLQFQLLEQETQTRLMQPESWRSGFAPPLRFSGLITRLQESILGRNHDLGALGVRTVHSF